MLYVANTSGILEYDGKDWNLIRTTNQSTVRSFAMDSNGTIYVGAIGDMGYLAADSAGQLIYISLVGQLPESERSFNDIWKVYATSRGVYFISASKVYRYVNHQFQIFIANIKSIRGFKINDEIYVFQKDIGICRIMDTVLAPLPGTKLFGDDLGRMVMMPYLRNSLLICTDKKGLFTYNLDAVPGTNDQKSAPDNLLRKFVTEADDYISYYGFYSCLKLDDNRFALGTFGGGIVLIDSNGRINRVINKNRGLNHDIVINLQTDRQHNLWACLLEGLSRIEINSPITNFTESSGLAGGIQASRHYNGIMYVAALSGLYYLPEYRLQIENDNHIFIPMTRQKFNCWDILSTSHGLYSSGSDGVLGIEGTNVKKLSNSSVIYCLGTSPTFPSGFFTGLIDGFTYYEMDTAFHKSQKDYRVKNVFHFPDITEPIRHIQPDEKGDLWLTSHYNGLLHVQFTNSRIDRYTIKRYTTSHGLPQNKWNYAYYINNRLVIATMNGLYTSTSIAGNRDSLRFIKDSSFGDYFLRDTNQVLQITPYDSNTYAVSTAYGFGLLKRSGENDYSWDPKPFKILPEGYMHYDTEGSVIWFSTTNGLYCYNPAIHKDFLYPFNVLIRRVTGGKNITLFHGTYSAQDANGEYSSTRFSLLQPVTSKPTLEYGQNALNFFFSGLFYELGRPMEYTYQLEGFNKEWSDWSTETKVAYTNLPAGEYHFKVKARNGYETVSSAAVYDFTILPPWYQTWWAYMLFFLIGFGLIHTIIRWRLHAIELEKHELERLIQERTGQIREQKNQLEQINTIVKAINTEYQSLNLLQSILEQTRVIHGVERCAAMIADHETGLYKIVASYGWENKNLETISLTLPEIEERYLRDTEMIDQEIYIAKHIKGRELEDKFIQFGLPQSMMVMLIRIEDSIKGLLIFDNYQRVDAFDEQDLLLLKNLREHIRSAYIKTQMLEELKRLNEKKNEFLGIAAHDLRNPLNAIMGYIELILISLKDGSFNKAESMEDMETILQVSRQMNHLVAELLDISAIESGKIRLDLHQENLQIIIDECEKLHNRHANQKNIQLVVDKNYMLPPVLVDRSRIMEVIDNLLSNAIKYTQPGGKVRLYCFHEDSHVSAHIQDTGQGLTEDDISKVFIGFKKLSARPTGGETSTGLGLAIVKKIVELHGGKVWVNSRYGEGTTFSFSLPVYDQQPQ